MAGSKIHFEEVKKIAQDVLLLVWKGAFKPELQRRYNIIPELSPKLMDHLSDSVLKELNRTKLIWDDFFTNHFERMTSSLELFSTYVAYAFCILNESSNAFECFFSILSIAAEFSFRCLQGDRKEYINTCADLFSMFFEKKLCQKFNKGGWKKFAEYIKDQRNQYVEFIDTNRIEPQMVIIEYFRISSSKRKKPFYRNRFGIINKQQQQYYIVSGIVVKDITQNQVETDKNAVSFVKSIELSELKKLVHMTFNDLLIEHFKGTFEVFQKEKNKPNETAMGLEKERREKEHSLQKVRHLPVGMQSEVELRRKPPCDVMKNQRSQHSSPKGKNFLDETQSEGAQKKEQSSDGMKNQVTQGSSQKIESTPDVLQIKETLEKGHKESSDGMENKADKWIYPRKKKKTKNESSSGGRQSKVAPTEKDQRSSYGIKNQVKECSWPEDVKPPDLESTPNVMQIKETLAKGHKESSDEMENKADEWIYPRKKKKTLKNESSSGGRQSKVAPTEKDQRSSYGIKNQVKECSSPEDVKPPDLGPSKEAQRKTYPESPDGMKNKVKQYSLNDKEAFEIVSCKTEVTKAEHEVKIAAGQATLRTQNLDTENSSHLSPANVTPSQASHIKLNPRKREKIKTSLENIAVALEKNSIMFHSEFGKY